MKTSGMLSVESLGALAVLVIVALSSHPHAVHDEGTLAAKTLMDDFLIVSATEGSGIGEMGRDANLLFGENASVEKKDGRLVINAGGYSRRILVS